MKLFVGLPLPEVCLAQALPWNPSSPEGVPLITPALFTPSGWGLLWTPFGQTPLQAELDSQLPLVRLNSLITAGESPGAS